MTKRAGWGLRGTLTAWFLLLSLLPLLLVSAFSYRTANHQVRQDALRLLRSDSEHKTARVRALFDRLLVDLQEVAGEASTAEFLHALTEAARQSGVPIREFVGSPAWEALVADGGADLARFKSAYGYYDLFMLDSAGNVLFTVARESDLGTNLFTGVGADTAFAGACATALRSGRPAFSDLELYAPSGGAVAGFLVDVLASEEGERAGLIAFQIPNDQINAILGEASELGESFASYLVGEDLIARSDSPLLEGDATLRMRVDTELTRAWLDEHLRGEGSAALEHVRSYPGLSGAPMLGIHHPLNVAGVQWAIVAEISEAEAFAEADRLRDMSAALLLSTAVLVLALALFLSRRIVRPLLALTQATGRVEQGDLDQRIEVSGRSEIGALAHSFDTMLSGLRKAKTAAELDGWLKTGRSELGDSIRGLDDVLELCREAVTFLARYVGAEVGALYLLDSDNVLRLHGSFAFQSTGPGKEFSPGEGIVGQCALDLNQVVITELPADYITIGSGLGETPPRNIVVHPIKLAWTLVGVLELGSLRAFDERTLTLLDQCSEAIAVAVGTARSRTEVRRLLEQTQLQASLLEGRQTELEEQTSRLQASEEELTSQQEELKAANEELEEQTQRLLSSEEELRAANEELRERGAILERQKRDVERSRQEIEQKAKELAQASKYKSEFLANMSHELRTPLNSLLILAELLEHNEDGNLTEDQVRSAAIIQSSGRDLLDLINEILDLAKIEAGRMEFKPADFALAELAEDLRAGFEHLAAAKQLTFEVAIGKHAPARVFADRQRVLQILKNLISNALKFTDEGGVGVRISATNSAADLSASKLEHAQAWSIAVADTGIGIPEELQGVVFEAFQQIDGTATRQHAGTGLGLSISRELAHLQGGEIHLSSEAGRGSTFTLHLPRQSTAEPVSKTRFIPPKPGLRPAFVPSRAPDTRGDREDATDGDRVILVIEADPDFAAVLAEQCRTRGFECVVTATGETGLEAAQRLIPQAVILDVDLPGIDGWEVLDHLKGSAATRHVPVHVVSTHDAGIKARRKGAIAHLTKPLQKADLEAAFGRLEALRSKDARDLLVVEDEATERKAIIRLIGNGDVRTTPAASGDEALRLLASTTFDCMVLDLGLPDMSGFDLLDAARLDPEITLPPVIVYTGRELTREQTERLREHTESIIIKGVQSPERLLDETSLFLHRLVDDLPEGKRKMLVDLHERDRMFEDRTVLMVDDDMRNVFALSGMLRAKGLKVLRADGGARALEILAEERVDLVLMDIMMPGMDGYEAMRRIRAQERFAELPIIALTAKAMLQDREKCINAGASDYLSKPVDMSRLLSMLRVWLYR